MENAKEEIDARFKYKTQFLKSFFVFWARWVQLAYKLQKGVMRLTKIYQERWICCFNFKSIEKGAQ